MTSKSRPVCVIVGAGPGNGAAFARRSAREGYRVALLARSTEVTGPLAEELHDGIAIPCDVTDSDAIHHAFAGIREQLGEVDVLVYNAGVGVWTDFEQTTPEQFETSWRTNAFGAFLASKEVVEAMKRRRSGHIIFIGATASRRGGARTAAFAPAKAAQKSLAESMARHLWPQNIHVSLIIVDGVVKLPRSRAFMKDKPDDFFISPDAVAATAFHLTTQHPSAWSFEVEARPFKETW